MSEDKKGRRKQKPADGGIGFFKHLGAGDHGPIERAGKIFNNLVRRSWGRSIVCCGNYGDPGC